MTTKEQLQSFNDFVAQRSATGSAELKLPDLFDLWVFETMGDAEYAENVAAVNASINDFLNGERGTPAGQHSEKLRQEFGISEG